MLNDPVDIYFIARPFQKEPSGRMAEDIEIPVVHSSQDAFGLRLPAKPKPRMNRANCVIQLFQEIVGIIERAVGKDVDLARFENTETPRPAIQLVDGPDLL